MSLRRSHRTFLAVSIACTVLLSSCHDDSNARRSFTERDSAGVRIVETAVPIWGAGEGWALAATPTLTIGGLRSDPGHELQQPWDALRLSDGRIVVADNANGELRFFADDGTFLFVRGGEGNGPGEYVALWQIAAWGPDSLVAYDIGNRRFSILDHEGRYHRSVMFADRPDVQPIDIFGDGSILAYGSSSIPIGERHEFVQQVRPLYRYGENRDSPFSFGPIDTVESYYQPLGESGRLSIPIPFIRSVAYATGRNALFYVNTPRFEVREYALDGTLRAIARASHEPQDVTREHIDAAYQLLHDRSAQEFIRTAVAQAFRNFSLSGTMPALGRWAWERVRMQRPNYAALHVDDLGNIWVIEYAPPGPKRRTWAVFEPGGRFLGSVLFPASFEPFHIGDDFVLGWSIDELDVVTVEMYALHKAG